METTRRVPEVYATPQAAHDAAAPGDTIELAHGVVHPPVILTKRVHIRGDTSDPAGEPCTIRGLSPITYTGGGAAGDVWVEGVTFEPQQQNQAISASAWAPAGVLRLNRCRLLGSTGWGWWVQVPTGAARVRMTHCSAPNGSNTNRAVYVPQTGAHEVEILAYEAPAEPQVWRWTTPRVDPNTMAVHVIDWAAVGSAGYGAAHGEFFGAQWQGVPYRLAGSEILEATDSPADSQILLYRETAYQSGRMEAFRWMETAPDPVTGEWEFRYLPTLDSAGNPQRYAVAINPPECYGGELLRWYPPQQGES
jgi:hypothetical protein